MSFFHGMILFFKALRFLLKNTRLIPYALVPALVTLLVSLASFTVILIYGDEFLAYAAPQYFEHQTGWFATFSVWIIKLALNVLVFFLIPFLVMLVAFPLCEPLATKCDDILGGKEVEVGLFSGIIRSFGVSIFVVLFGLIGAITLLFLGFIPVVGFVAPLIQIFLWTPFLLCFDLCDSLFARRSYAFSRRFSLLFKTLGKTVSVGLVASLCVSIPFLNLMTLPIAIVMGTMYGREIEQENDLLPLDHQQEL